MNRAANSNKQASEFLLQNPFAMTSKTCVCVEKLIVLTAACRDAGCVDSNFCLCVCTEVPGVLTAKLVSRASRVSSKGSVEAAAASRLQS